MVMRRRSRSVRTLVSSAEISSATPIPIDSPTTRPTATFMVRCGLVGAPGTSASCATVSDTGEASMVPVCSQSSTTVMSWRATSVARLAAARPSEPFAVMSMIVVLAGEVADTRPRTAPTESVSPSASIVGWMTAAVFTSSEYVCTRCIVYELPWASSEVEPAPVVDTKTRANDV
nr:hypothetical protein [Demequina sediminis]